MGGGVSLSIILSIELIACFIACCYDKTPDMMGNIMYLIMASEKMGFGFFMFYRFLSHYILLILITIFAAVDVDSVSVPEFTERNSITFGRELGLIFFVWSWMGGIIGHCAFIGVVSFGGIGGADTNRDIVEYLMARQFAEAEQLLMFGVNPKVNKYRQNVLHGLCRYAKNCFGDTPIMMCAYHADGIIYQEKQEREEIILFLLEQGAETHHKGNAGKDLLYYCKKNGLKNAENMILKMQKVDEDEM